MIRKIIPIILCFALAFSICTAAAAANDDQSSDSSAPPNEAVQQERIPGGGRMGGGRGGMGGGMPSAQSTPDNTQSTGDILNFVKTYSTPVISVILLALAYVFVIFYKRKRY